MENNKINYNYDKNILEVEEQSKSNGADQIFKVSIVTEKGIKELKKYIDSNS